MVAISVSFVIAMLEYNSRHRSSGYEEQGCRRQRTKVVTTTNCPTLDPGENPVRKRKELVFHLYSQHLPQHCFSRRVEWRVLTEYLWNVKERKFGTLMAIVVALIGIYQ